TPAVHPEALTLSTKTNGAAALAISTADESNSTTARRGAVEVGCFAFMRTSHEKSRGPRRQTGRACTERKPHGLLRQAGWQKADRSAPRCGRGERPRTRPIPRRGHGLAVMPRS